MHPVLPLESGIEDASIDSAIELSTILFSLLIVIEELQEEDPRYLLSIVHRSGYAIISAENIGDAVDLLFHRIM